MPSGSMSFSFCDFRRAAGVRSTPQTPCSSSWTGLPKVSAVILDSTEAGDPWRLPGVLLRRLSSISGGDIREIQAHAAVAAAKDGSQDGRGACFTSVLGFYHEATAAFPCRYQG